MTNRLVVFIIIVYIEKHNCFLWDGAFLEHLENKIIELDLSHNPSLDKVKDIFILDVVLESVNNPTRLLMGWFLISPNLLPPISIIFFLWFVGCFLMTMKRYSEYKFIKQKKII